MFSVHYHFIVSLTYYDPIEFITKSVLVGVEVSLISLSLKMFTVTSGFFFAYFPFKSVLERLFATIDVDSFRNRIILMCQSYEIWLNIDYPWCSLRSLTHSCVNCGTETKHMLLCQLCSWSLLSRSALPRLVFVPTLTWNMKYYTF